jgi:hypothetical protein
MTQQEIQERNEQIALMLGWIPYEGLNPRWRNSFETNCNSEIFNKVVETLKFHSDWNWLMEAVKFIKKNIRTSNNTSDAKVGEYFIDEWEFKVKNYYVRLIQWTEKGWRMSDKDNMDLSIRYVIGMNCSSEIEAVFSIVSDFAKLYNTNENK